MCDGDKRLGEKRSAEMFTMVAVQVKRKALKDVGNEQKLEAARRLRMLEMELAKRMFKGLYSAISDSI